MCFPCYLQSWNVIYFQQTVTVSGNWSDVCEHVSQRYPSASMWFLNIVCDYSSTTPSPCKNTITPVFRGQCVALDAFRRFVVRGDQNGGCCIGSDTVYCYFKSEECAEKGMTQNSKHNRFLSAPANKFWFLSSHATPFPWWTQSSRSLLSMCACLGWRGGVSQSSFHSCVPADPWGHGGHSLQRWSLLSSAAHSESVTMVSRGMCWSRSLVMLATQRWGSSREGGFREDAGTKGCYVGLLVHKTWTENEWAHCITRG